MICLKRLQRCHGVLTASEVLGDWLRFRRVPIIYVLRSFTSRSQYYQYVICTKHSCDAVPSQRTLIITIWARITYHCLFASIKSVTSPTKFWMCCWRPFAFFRIALMTQSRLEMGFKNLYFKKFQMWASGEYAIVLVSCKLLVLC